MSNQTSSFTGRSTSFDELNSEEVQEIISRPPTWLVSWGMTLFLGVLLLLAVGSWMIRYPDIITVPFTLISTDAPLAIFARTEGKLVKLLIKDGQQVLKSQVLGYSESTADHEQIMKLGIEMEQMSYKISNNSWTSIEHFEVFPYTQLGELQNDFQTFNQKLIELKSFLNGGFYLQKQKLLYVDKKDLADLGEVLSEQLVLQNKDYELAKNEFHLQEKLYETKLISSQEYKREKAKLLSFEIPIQNLTSSVIQNRSAQTAKQIELLELENASQEHKAAILQSIQTLRSKIDNWRQRFVLIAPIAGKVYYSAPLREQQHLIAGQELMTLEPPISSFQGLVKIPQTNMGKLKDGQTVLIKLDGFSYREYGMIEGYLSQISVVPGRDSAYWGYVKLPKKLKTRYGHTVPYRNGLRGQAEIITADRRLAERLMSTIRDGGN